MIYRRSRTAGGTYFFTVNTHNRRQLLCIPENVELLRQALKYMMHRHPVEINAIVLLPDHLHCLWTLPKDDHNYSMRWMLVKSYFSRHCNQKYEGIVSKSRQSKQERGFWQRRFWEHTIQDEDDFIKHVEYIHYNPVKHGYVPAPMNWKYSSFHRYVKLGVYDVMWGANEGIIFDPHIGNE